MPAIDRKICGSRERIDQTPLPSSIPFLVQARQPLALGPNDDPLSQIQIFSPYRLSSTHPTVGCQKGMPLAINTPQLALLRYIVRVALDSDP